MRKKWDKQLVIEEFRKFEESGEEITPKNLREKRNDLLVQIRRKFGTYRSFIEQVGYDYESVIGFKVWSKQRIAAEVLSRRDSGKSLMRRDMELECPDLLSALTKHFGSFKKGIESCGVDYDEVLGFTWWDKEKVVREFLKLYKDPKITTITKLRERNRGLDHAVRKYYGSYDNLCSDLQLDVTKIRPEVYEWSADDLLSVLRECRDNGTPLNVSSVHSVFPSAVKVANRHFGSYAAALAEIGEEYPKHEDDRLLSSALGYEFEGVVAEMFERLGAKYERHYRGVPGIVPDFYCEETKEIVDAKLSSWTVFNCETIKKYSPHCERLTVVYLRGPEIDHQVSNLTLKPVGTFYDALRRLGHDDIIDSFEHMRRTIPECA